MGHFDISFWKCNFLFETSNEKFASATNGCVLLGPIEVTEDGTQLFNCCLFKWSVFHSTKYSRPNKTKDILVSLVIEEIGEIYDFKYINGQTVVIFSTFSEVPDDLLSVSHIKKVVQKNGLVTVPIQAVDKK